MPEAETGYPLPFNVCGALHPELLGVFECWVNFPVPLITVKRKKELQRLWGWPWWQGRNSGKLQCCKTNGGGKWMSSRLQAFLRCCNQYECKGVTAASVPLEAGRFKLCSCEIYCYETCFLHMIKLLILARLALMLFNEAVGIIEDICRSMTWMDNHLEFLFLY